MKTCLTISLLALGVLVGCSPKPAPQVPPTENASMGSNSENLYNGAPFYTTSIGPKSLADPNMRDGAWKDGTGMYCVINGDADGLHRFIDVGPWSPEGYYGSVPVPTKENIRDWKTEHGFGIGSASQEVRDKIGWPTGAAHVAGYWVEMYVWKYETDFLRDPQFATYQLTITYTDDVVVGIVIEVDEMM